jgi:hypothetical protein
VSSEPEATITSDADEVERHPCPRCLVEPGSPCRSRSGAVAGTYHTGRFTKVPRLAKLLRVPTPADRGLGQPWRPGTPPPAPIPSDTPTADIRVGYARCSHLTQELQSQLGVSLRKLLGATIRGISPGQHIAVAALWVSRQRPTRKTISIVTSSNSLVGGS